MPATQLDVVADRLNKAAPQQFNDFIKMLELRLHDLMQAVAFAQSGEILVKQGHAQEATALIRILKECSQKCAPKPTPQTSPP